MPRGRGAGADRQALVCPGAFVRALPLPCSCLLHHPPEGSVPGTPFNNLMVCQTPHFGSSAHSTEPQRHINTLFYNLLILTSNTFTRARGKATAPGDCPDCSNPAERRQPTYLFPSPKRGVSPRRDSWNYHPSKGFTRPTGAMDSTRLHFHHQKSPE